MFIRLRPRVKRNHSSNGEASAEDLRAFAIVACQRSGTHLLREILNSNLHIAVVAEPLTRSGEPNTWYHFLENLPKQELPFYSSVEAADFFNRYIQHVRQHSRERCEVYGGPKQSPTLVGLDVKYNQIKCVNPLFSDLRLRPFLLDYFSSRRFQIIHLVRHNVVQQAISMIVANLRKVWQNCDRSTLEGPYKVPTIELLDHMRWIQAERTAFETLTRDLQIHSPSYEDIVADVQQAGSDGTLRKNSKAISPIADFLRVPNRFNRNRCLPKVINRPYRDVIENYDEVVSTLKASPYADFADTI